MPVARLTLSVGKAPLVNVVLFICQRGERAKVNLSGEARHRNKQKRKKNNTTNRAPGELSNQPSPGFIYSAMQCRHLAPEVLVLKIAKEICLKVCEQNSHEWSKVAMLTKQEHTHTYVQSPPLVQATYGQMSGFNKLLCVFAIAHRSTTQSQLQKSSSGDTARRSTRVESVTIITCTSSGALYQDTCWFNYRVTSNSYYRSGDSNLIVLKMQDIYHDPFQDLLACPELLLQTQNFMLCLLFRVGLAGSCHAPMHCGAGLAYCLVPYT